MVDVGRDCDLDRDYDCDREPERDHIDLLAEDFAARCRRGERPSVSEYASRHPESAERIRAILPAVAMMEQLRRDRRGPAGTEEGAREAARFPGLERLGDLRIVREIGRGGMGIVYEAVQESLGRRVALKVLPRHGFLDPRTLQRFQREAQAVARLRHPGIVPVFAIGEHDGLHYYVMQLIPGRGLHEVIRGLRRGVAPGLDQGEGQGPVALDGRHWRFVARVGVQVAAALESAHDQGVLHRDIKPANLLLDDNDPGAVWVTDFGLAKLERSGDLTATGDIVGTLQYMAPEGLQGCWDARSDVYGLGMTLYELLTLEPPFEESNPSRLLRRVGEDQPVRPRKRNPAIPRDLETVVLKAIAREPGDRYPSARALGEDLQQFLDDRPIRARRVAVTEQLGRWCRRNKTLAAFGVIALGSLAFAAVVGWAGYATTRQALESESRRRREADAATRRAEANVSLSLQALEQIFNNLNPRAIGPDHDHGRDPGWRRPGPGTWPSSPPPSREWFEGWSSETHRPPPAPPPPPSRRGIDEGQTALLQSILEFYDRFAELNETNAPLKREAAQAHRRIGEIRQRLGEFDAAEKAFLRAATFFEALVIAFPQNREDRHALAETLLVQESRSESTEVIDAVLPRWRRALAIEEGLALEDPDSWRYLATSAEIEGKLAAAQDVLGRTREAEASLRRAVALRESLLARVPEGSLAPIQLAAAHATLGGFLLRHDRTSEARSDLDSAAERLRDAAKRPSPGSTRFLAQEFEELALLYTLLGETAEAEALTNEAQSLQEPRPTGRRAGQGSGFGPGPPPFRGGHGPGARVHDRPPREKH